MQNTDLLILLGAEFDLVSSNAKRLKNSDELLHSFGLLQCQQVSQLLHEMNNNNLIFAIAKVVDGIKVAGAGKYPKIFLTNLNKTFKLGKIVIGSGRRRLF